MPVSSFPHDKKLIGQAPTLVTLIAKLFSVFYSKVLLMNTLFQSEVSNI